MNNKSEWNNIIIARGVEVLFIMGAAVVGLWYSIKSKELDDALDNKANALLKENEDEDDSE